MVSPYISLQALAALAALAALVPGAQVRHTAGAGHGDLQAFPVCLDAVRSAIRAAMAPR